MSSAFHPILALVGPPNSGKTTLYNWITGSHSKTVNYPGATVDYHIGESLDIYGPPLQVIDTPGTYSLFPKSPEEQVTQSILLSAHRDASIDLLIVVIDSTQFVRQMSLIEQLKSLEWPFVVALTMTDVVASQSGEINIEQLSKETGATVIPIDGRLGGGVQQLMKEVRHLKKDFFVKPKKTEVPPSWTSEDFKRHQAKWSDIYNRSFRFSETSPKEPTEQQLDRWLLHPWFGFFIFAFIMLALFSSIFWAAAPFMDWIDQGMGTLANIVINLSPQSLWTDFLANGVIAGFGAFLVFVPQIFILFFGLNLLEDSGYLARAASLVDKPLSLIGLNGRSFVPLLAGHACAVPAMMATRTIPNKKERWLTLAILPLMTCSARLPVYALLLSFLFSSPLLAGAWLAIIYIGGFIFAGLISAIISRWMKKDSSSFFLLELPHYRRPHLFTVFRLSLEKTKSFIFRAGPIIFVLSLVIWVLTTFPAYEEPNDHARITQSYAAQLGQTIEPIMQPMGLDWKAGIGIISSIAAREVFVSTMALVYNIGDEDEDRLQVSLKKAMQSATFKDGTPIFTTGSIAGLIVFYMIALQCIATLGIARREANSWTFAIGQLVAYNLLAYFLAISVNHLLS
ncbi:MAG: ferrous iron transporter B [Bdellovibrionales bacterium]|nr:ferrous iron transporter B [Bdellovibrionales bacterium]